MTQVLKTNNITEEELQKLKNDYPIGCRIKLIHMDEEMFNMEDGLLGTVTSISGIGVIHVNWDNGRRVGLCYDVDLYRRVD